MNIDDASRAAPQDMRGSRLRSVFACAAAVAALAGCGGGSDGDDTSAPAPAPTPAPTPVAPPPAPVATVLSGVAATGAALADAAVAVTDQTGANVCSTTTDAQGIFRCPLPAGTPRPLVVRASKEETVLYSATADTGDARANVTPLTTIIAAKLAPDGNPASLAAAVQSAPQSVTAATLKAQSDALVAALQPLLTALGVSIEPLAGELQANGTGQDKVLDTIAVSVRPDGTASNIEITVKAKPSAVDSAPLSIQFRSDTAAVPALPATLTAADVDAVPTPAAVADLTARMTACYALPLSQRVTAPSDSTPVVGGPADIIAPQCRSLFVGDDPASYLSSGSRVGRSASNTGSFSGLFRPGSTGVVYSNGNFEYFRPNGDLIVTAQWRDTQGNFANDSYAVRDVGGTLKLIGNQYAYSAAVRPFTEDREFLNTPQFSYYNTGYNVRVNNITDSSGNPIFRKVVATTPWGTQLTLLPAPGQLLLAISPDGTTLTGTSILRLGAGYRDTTLVADPPWVKDSGAAVAAGMLTDTQIAQLNDQGLWTFEFFFTDTSKANVIQRSRTLARPHTVAEVRQLSFASFMPDLLADLVAESAATGSIRFAVPEVAEIGDASSPGWAVPALAVAPSSVGLFGRAPFGSTTAGVSGNRYDDFANVSATARYTTVFCSPQTASDKHCDAGSPGSYAAGSTVNMLELWGLNSRLGEVSKKAALYKLQ